MPAIAPGTLRVCEADRLTQRAETARTVTGLGMSIHRKVPELRSHDAQQKHGGTLAARSEVGHGATFEIRLPVVAVTTEVTA